MSRKSKRRDSDDEDQEIAQTVPLIIMFVVYVFAGAFLMSMYEPDMTFFKAVYFNYVSLTSIGLGDIVPRRHVLKISNHHVSTDPSPRSVRRTVRYGTSVRYDTSTGRINVTYRENCNRTVPYAILASPAVPYFVPVVPQYDRVRRTHISQCRIAVGLAYESLSDIGCCL